PISVRQSPLLYRQGLSMLTEAQRLQYQRDGYLVLRGLFGDEADAITRWVDELAAAPEVRGTIMKYLEDDPAHPGARILNRIENFVPYHNGFCRIATQSALVDAVSELLGEPAVLFKDKINFKMPGGTGFEAH